MTPTSKIIPYGYCHCGCGNLAPISRYTDARTGSRRGFSLRYISGHNFLQERSDVTKCAHFRLYGVYCRLIALTQGQYAIVSEDCYAEYSRWTWCAMWADGKCYAVRTSRRKTILMHRQVLGLGFKDDLEGDHIDPLRTTENCIGNLRKANRQQQCMNSSKKKHGKGRFKGATYDKSRGKWMAQITLNGTLSFLGRFDTEEEAHAAYRQAAVKHFGEFARFE